MTAKGHWFSVSLTEGYLLAHIVFPLKPLTGTDIFWLAFN